MTLRVLVADDQEIVRTGLRMIVDAQPGMEVVATAADGHEALARAKAHAPDVCLLDIRMPGLDGIEVTRRLAGPQCAEPMAVVVITTFDQDEYVLDALKAGARGFLLKDAGPELLAQAIRAAAEGGALIAPRVMTRMLGTLVGPSRERPEPSEPLSEREEEVLRAVARGLTNAEIGRELFISLSTVKTHVAHLMEKLDARNRVEIAIWAHETGRAGSGRGPKV
ncbi:MAG: response regulator transcription factor [Myxococcota bacterium]